MRICLIGKYPPIQGGVSMRTYWAAHGLAARGHEVHVVTNAKEAQPPFRMHMRPMDWACCDMDYGDGSVTMHWTDPVDPSQIYIPMASPFVSKLAGIVMKLHAERAFDVIFSFYLEPYGVAGHLAAQMTGTPHVVRTAGSDAGRLWRHPQLEPLYDQVLRCAAAMITGRAVAERAIGHGVDPSRIAFAGGVVVPEHIFTPDGSVLDLAALRNEVATDPDLRELLWGDFAADRPYFGVYGKLGDSKGSFALLEALHRLDRDGIDVGLVALAHGTAAVQARFRSRAQELGLTRRILQIPFVPHWRVPEFLRGCLAVCCLEQDFPIAFRTPIVLREVLLCGKCLVAATEVIRKLPGYDRLPDGYGCVAIEDVNDIDKLSARLAAVARDPAPTTAVGARGRRFALELQSNTPALQELERVLEAGVARQHVRSTADESPHEAEPESIARFRLTRLARAALDAPDCGTASGTQAGSASSILDLSEARDVLAAIERRIAGSDEERLRAAAEAVRAEIAVAEAESEADASVGRTIDPLFRLRFERWAVDTGDIARLFCLRNPRLRMLSFDFDVAELATVHTVADLASAPATRRSHIVAFGRTDDGRREPLVVDEVTAKILGLSDGTRTAFEIVSAVGKAERSPAARGGLDWIEELFVRDLISFCDRKSVSSAPPESSGRSRIKAAWHKQFASF